MGDKKAPAGPPLGGGTFWAVTYGLISIAITLFNKAVLSSYGFNSTMTLTLLQGVVTIVCLTVMKHRGYIDYPAFSWDVARKVAPLSFVFIAYVVISLISLGRVNVPMFTALRRLTIVFVMMEEYWYLGITPSMRVVNTVVVMCIGAAIAAWKDLSFDYTSYFYLFLTNLFTSLYTVYINVVKKETNLNVFAMLYYNNVTTMPFLFILAVVTGDLQEAISFKYMYDWSFQLNFLSSIFLAFLLNVATFYCTTLNSARTQTVVGQLKNFFAFLMGLVLFNDYIYEPYNFVGLLIGFAGGVWYSYVTYADKIAKDAAKAAGAAAAASGATAGKLADASTDGGGAEVVVPPTPSADAVDDLAASEAGYTTSGPAGLVRRANISTASSSTNSSTSTVFSSTTENFSLDHDRGLVRGDAAPGTAAASAAQRRH